MSSLGCGSRDYPACAWKSWVSGAWGRSRAGVSESPRFEHQSALEGSGRVSFRLGGVW